MGDGGGNLDWLTPSENLGDLPNVSTARTNLGLGTAAVINTPVSVANGGTGADTAGQLVANIVSSASAPGATPSMDTDNFNFFEFTGLATAITSMSTNLTGTPNDGDQLSIRLTDNGTNRAITWGAKFLASGVQSLLSTTSAGKTHLIRFLWDATATAWVCWYVDATGYTA
jgi:hypothetical protein